MSGKWSEAELAHMKWRKAQKEKEKEEARERSRRKQRSRSASRGRRSRSLSSDRGSPQPGLVGGSPPPDPKRPEHDLRMNGRYNGMRHRRVRSRSRERKPRSRSRSRSRDRSSKKRHKKEKKRKHKDKKSSKKSSASAEKGAGGDAGERVDKFGRTLPAGRERSPSVSSVESAASSKGNSRSRSRSRSHSESRQRWWGHDKYMEARDVDDDEEVRKRLPLDYVPPQPTWKSKAGGVYIPLQK